ncbi:MAG: hypothetical protein GXX91_11500 [Verrucomicrobiaceae bacterium]|nr:hypothetical protein [Verrucomicrobiaceae bacterium]
MTTPQKNDLEEPLRKKVGGDLSSLGTFARIAMLQQNADALLGKGWRGKDDGTLVRKIVGSTRGSGG